VSYSENIYYKSIREFAAETTFEIRERQSYRQRGRLSHRLTRCDVRLGTVLFRDEEFAIDFYSARNARIASTVLATAIPSVCLSVRHTPVLCQNDGT